VAEDDWSRGLYHRPEERRKGGAGPYFLASLMLLALLLLCGTAFLLVRALLPDRSPGLLPVFVTWTPSAAPLAAETQPTVQPTEPGSTGGFETRPNQATVSVDPEQGPVNTLVTVSGQGWWPGEPVFIFLRSAAEGEGRGYSYAAAVADEWGNIRTALTFPNEMRWVGQEWADVIARGTRSGEEANTRFHLIAPTATNTPLPPTVPPTRAPTDTPLPTATPLPTPAPEMVISDWRGEYFDNPDLRGDPVLVRNDEAIDLNWGLGSPEDGIPADRFSARWTRSLYFDGGSYLFAAMADDGVRFWIDDQLVVDEWHDSTQETYTVEVDLAAGEHALLVEYYENLGGAAIYLNWAPIEPPTPTPNPPPAELPTSLPEPTAGLIPTSTILPPPFDAWWGEYFDNVSLEGDPVLARLDPEVDFDWGLGSPGDGVPADDFSARWIRQIWVPAGTYRYSLEVDDGARLWVDGNLLIDAWPATIGNVYAVETTMSEGTHTLQVEYFEITIEARIHLWSEAVP
jgi:hypothetical protein